MAYAYAQTYGLPVIITRASNNFGPWQNPAKLIPLFREADSRLLVCATNSTPANAWAAAITMKQQVISAVRICTC